MAGERTFLVGRKRLIMIKYKKQFIRIIVDYFFIEGRGIDTYEENKIWQYRDFRIYRNFGLAFGDFIARDRSAF